jgi:hypothetical protein
MSEVNWNERHRPGSAGRWVLQGSRVMERAVGITFGVVRAIQASVNEGVERRIGWARRRDGVLVRIAGLVSGQAVRLTERVLESGEFASVGFLRAIREGTGRVPYLPLRTSRRKRALRMWTRPSNGAEPERRSNQSGGGESARTSDTTDRTAPITTSGRSSWM